MDHASIPDDSLVVRSVGGSGSPDGAVAAALALARDILGLSTVIVAPADGPAPRVAYADDGGFGLRPGDSIPLPDALRGGGGQTGPVVLMANGSADGVPLGAGTFVGMPLADGDGRAVGVLCALDRQPRPLPAEAIGRLRLLAPLVAHALGSEPSRSRDRVGQR
ncbi:MAG TPA: GAF domain-containing protein [Thermomicrobiales bacterium]|nr:GAF domain-containing protein [Thermomicrobiales bacterium]